MNIGIAGYGKMGEAVERIASERSHHTHILTKGKDGYTLPKDIDCVIDFTHGSVAPDIIRACISRAIPIVSGTTGWDASLEEIRSFCVQKDGALLWSPNFSVGMQIVFDLNRRLAQLMEARPEYNVTILETHHTQKKDKPSGTAIALARQILQYLSRKSGWVLKTEGAVKNDEAIAVVAERKADVKGIHRVTYVGPHDVISLRHKALSRDAFALGAVLAAEWLVTGRKGVFTFADVLERG